MALYDNILQAVLDGKVNLPKIISVGSRDVLGKAIKRMHKFNISQIPVIDGDTIAGSINEAALMKLL
jgi:predicted transcriptional regulator